MSITIHDLVEVLTDIEKKYGDIEVSVGEDPSDSSFLDTVRIAYDGTTPHVILVPE